MPLAAFVIPLAVSTSPWRTSGRQQLQPQRTARFQPRVSTRCVSPVRRMTPTCFEDAPDPDEDSEEEQLLLTDQDGRTLSCGVEHYMEHQGENYVLCYPIHDPVIFARIDQSSGQLEAVEDSEVIDLLFDNARAVLAEDDLKLLRSAYVLTVDDSNRLDDDEEEEEEGFEGQEEGDLEDDEQEVEVLSQFLHDGMEFVVVKPTEPVLLVAMEVEDGFAVLKGKDLQRITPAVEAFIENLDDDDDDV